MKFTETSSRQQKAGAPGSSKHAASRGKSTGVVVETDGSAERNGDVGSGERSMITAVIDTKSISPVKTEARPVVDLKVCFRAMRFFLLF
jgi:hypothetical protein